MSSTNGAADVVLKNARLADGSAADIVIAGDRIAAVAAPGGGGGAPTIDLRGQCVLPGLVDGHMHLDKTLMGLDWVPHRAKPYRMSRIETDKWLLPSLPLGTESRAAALVDRCVAHGTAHIRTHVDIDLEGKVSKLEAVMALREKVADRVTIQLVAFPQSGVSRCPGVIDLLEESLGMGAELVGGIDPCEIDKDPKGQLDGIFGLAEKYGRGVDIHLHEAGELGLFNVFEICARTKAHGLSGNVTISHGFCLGGVAESRFGLAAEAMAEAGVCLVTHGAAGLPLPPIAQLRAAGVTVFAGNDDVRDTWSPYGNADMLERASLIGWRADFRTDETLMDVFDVVTASGARALRIGDYGVVRGGRADFFTVEASGAPEAVGGHPPRKLVVFAGRLVAKDGAALPAAVPLADYAASGLAHAAAAE